jgi:glucose/arabinose dehydrogenase
LAASSIHNGSRLVIANDKLFITTGDASNTSLPKNISARNGKVLRLNLDGSIPADNPVAGNAYWSFGHRNPQGLVYANNRLYSSEHGPSNDDEINIIEKGKNYGWPNVAGRCEGSEQSFLRIN